MPVFQQFPVRGALFGGGCPYDDPMGTGRPHRDGCRRVLPASVPEPLYSVWLERSSELFAAGTIGDHHPIVARSIFVMTAIERARNRAAVPEPASDRTPTSWTSPAGVPTTVLRTVDAIVAAVRRWDLPPVAPAHVDLAVTCVIERVGDLEATVAPDVVAELAAAAADLAHEAIVAATTATLPPGRRPTPAALSAVSRELYGLIPSAVDTAIDRRRRG